MSLAETAIAYDKQSSGEIESWSHACVHVQVSQHAAANPDHTAACCGERSLTYGDLERCANRLAHRLVRNGVGPEVSVAIAVEPSLELLVGILAVLKAGGAYLPLDPEYPPARLGFMLADAAPQLLLVTSASACLLPTYECPVITIDDALTVFDSEPVEPICHATRSDELAYIIYTSGSTGRPKGVMIEHRGLTSLVRTAGRVFGINSSSRVLQFASICYDVSIMEIFMTVCNGATLCFAPRARLVPGTELATLLRDLRITFTTLPPSALDVMSEQNLPDLDVVAAGGETCTAAIASRWAAGRRFINAYGPAETTVLASAWKFDPNETGDPPIGTSCDATTLHVLDDHLQPVPDGTVGELYIGGPGVARGYLGRPELTAERFGPDPFSADIGARLYRTGDRALRRPDGNLEFHGRTDEQIKLHGHRIELGEIEAVMRDQCHVKQVAVTVHDSGGHKKLIAHVVSNSPGEGDATAIKRLLAAQLPNHMVPARFVWHERLPLTLAGKIDRSILKIIDPVPQAIDAAAGGTEQVMLRIWREILGFDQIGLHENFVELGGDSLASVKISMAAEDYGLIVAPQAMFDHPTIAELAVLIDANHR
jgi:amino acid adenylation domain-containing protein